MEKMRDDFAVFILTHGRADNVITKKSLECSRYSGKWYMIIDDEDETRDKYVENFGEGHVIVFDKQAACDRTDTMDNFNKHSAIVYARNESFRIAKNLGLKYFLMLDDDYKSFDFRYVQIENGKKKLAWAKVRNADALFTAMINFLEASKADTVALCQGGDFVGGVDGTNIYKGLLRKAMNSFFCRTDTPIEFKGTMNEDVVTYTTEGSRGRLFLSCTKANINQLQTQKLKGGMSQEYKDYGTYLKSFYAVISMPSAVKVHMQPFTHKRLHHRVDWECCVPKILNEKWRRINDSQFYKR